MSRPFALPAILACACAVALPAPVLAQDPAAEVPEVAESVPQSVTTGAAYAVARAVERPDLWATVNICDTEANPNSMGIRASMPGNGSDQRMWMRFSAEYWSRARQAWTRVSGSGISPWIYAGSARYARRQAGWTFAFSAPPAGVTFTMRAQVEFEWRAKRAAPRRDGERVRRVARSDARTTETGIRGVYGGDPPGTSKAMCLIY